MEPKHPRQSEVTMTELVMPGDANNVQSAFGGRVMQWIDTCAAVAAGRHCRSTVVTASMDDLHFHAPIGVGWVVTLRARVLAAFRTSVEVGVTVVAERPVTGEEVLTTSALLTFVALGADGKTTAVPPLLLETDEEREAFKEAQARRDERIARQRQGTRWQRTLGQRGA